jgi:DNA-binding response OmpR family regulator
MVGFNLLATSAEDERARDRFSGEPERVTLSCGTLTLYYDPLEFYVGDQQISLSPLEGAILELLMRQGRASSKVLIETFEREGASANTLDVHVYRIRRKFTGAGLFDPIETVRGWGLKLRIPGNDMQRFTAAASLQTRM